MFVFWDIKFHSRISAGHEKVVSVGLLVIYLYRKGPFQPTELLGTDHPLGEGVGRISEGNSILKLYILCQEINYCHYLN